MKKKYRIKGLDCPNCAKKLENELNKIGKVKNLEINFVKGEMNFDCEEEDFVFLEIVKMTKKLEPGVVISKQEDKNKCCEGYKSTCSCYKDNKKSKNFRISLILFIIGCVFAVLSFVFKSANVVTFYIFLVLSVLLIGYKTFYKAIVLLTKKTVNENLLITISVFGAVFIEKEMEALMVIFLYTIGKFLEGLAVDKSRKSIEKLTKFKPEFARVLKENGKEVLLSPKNVKIGDVILVKPGERVPLDGKIVEGSASIDTQSLTGESLPVLMKCGDKILSGVIVLDGVLKVEIETLYKNSTINKILNLIENASEKKSKTETFISKVAKWYTLGVMFCAVAVFGIVILISKNFDTAFYRGLIFLVISCPCAFAISVPLSYFSGLGRASKEGILIKGSNFIDLCSKINVVGFDKTGTITTGKFIVKNVEVIDKKYSKEDVLYLASLGEQYSNHPLAKGIVNANKRELVNVKSVSEKIGVGVKFLYQDSNYFVGRDSSFNKVEEETVVNLTKDEKLIARIYLVDDIKENCYYVIEKLKKLGVRNILLSGDKEKVVKNISKNVGIENCYFELMPEDKFKIIENECKKIRTTFGYVGDGLNDAPGLNLSDVGFCMGINGNDASIESSDVVIVDDNLEKVVSSIKISKFTRKIVFENIIGSMGIKLLFLTLGAIGVTGMLWAVFADVGVTICAILNCLRILKFKIKN